MLTEPKPTGNTGAPASLAWLMASSMVPPWLFSPSVISTMALRPLRGASFWAAVTTALYSAVEPLPPIPSMALLMRVLSVVKSSTDSTESPNPKTATASEEPSWATSALAAAFSSVSGWPLTDPLWSITRASDMAVPPPVPVLDTVVVWVVPSSLSVKLLEFRPVTGLPLLSVTEATTVILGQVLVITWLILAVSPPVLAGASMVNVRVNISVPFRYALVRQVPVRLAFADPAIGSRSSLPMQ